MKEAHVLTSMVIGCLLVLLFAGCTEPRGNIDDGSRWYTMYRCNGCHGERGMGGEKKAPKLAGTDQSFSAFRSKIRNARSGIMPSYSEEQIPDQDIADMFAFLKAQQ